MIALVLFALLGAASGEILFHRAQKYLKSIDSIPVAPFAAHRDLSQVSLNSLKTLTVFPWCKCINNDPCDPLALSYDGEQVINGVTYIEFSMTFKNGFVYPGTCGTTCANSDIGKVEFNVGE